MGHLWQRCLSVGHPASNPGVKADDPLEEQNRRARVGGVMIAIEEKNVEAKECGGVHNRVG